MTKCMDSPSMPRERNTVLRIDAMKVLGLEGSIVLAILRLFQYPLKEEFYIKNI